MKRAETVLDDNHGKIEIRQARLRDLPLLLPLVRAYYRFDGIRFRARPLKEALARMLASPRLGRAWIFFDGSDAVGYLILTYQFDIEFGGFEGLITDLFLNEKYRGRGIGNRALEMVDEYCRSAGISTVELQVIEENVRAQDFYRKAGFKRLNRIIMTREVKARRQPAK